MSSYMNLAPKQIIELTLFANGICPTCGGHNTKEEIDEYAAEDRTFFNIRFRCIHCDDAFPTSDEELKHYGLRTPRENQRNTPAKE